MSSFREFQSPDEACADFADSGETIVVKGLDGFVLIEGTETALLRFAEVVAARARFRKDDGFEASPQGPGGRIFGSGSNFGLYLRVVREGRSDT